MIERHYCTCGAKLEASGDEAAVKGITVMFWRSHNRDGHAPTSAAVCARARTKHKRQ